jgi:hypothetical protein
MSKYMMVVQSKALAGRDADFNKWYDSQHLPEICSLPGVKSGRRFEATPISMGTPGLQYLALYELDVDDPGSLMAEMAKRSAEGTMSSSDALDKESAVLWLYKAR